MIMTVVAMNKLLSKITCISWIFIAAGVGKGAMHPPVDDGRVKKRETGKKRGIVLCNYT